jgi:hypothetical protein
MNDSMASGSGCAGKRVNNARIIAVCIIVLTSALSVSGQEVLSSQSTSSLFRETVSRLGNASLSADQIARIQELADKYEPQIRNAEKEANSQQRVADEAIAQLVAKGLRGEAAREALKSLPDRSADERTAFLTATRLRLEFDRAVMELLTDAQRSDLQQRIRQDKPQVDFLIVQLSQNLPLPPRSANTLDDAAAALKLPDLRAIIAKYGLNRSERAVKSELLDRVKETNNEVAREIRLLRTFWQIDVRAMRFTDVQSSLRSLNELPEIEHAYAALGRREPSACVNVSPSDDQYYGNQGYLLLAPVGINAPAAWSLPAGRGAGVGLVDLERGWNIDHEDLSAFLGAPLYGQRQPGNDHGTSVVGEIASEDNDKGMVGAAPCVEYVALTSRYHAPSGFSEPHVANAIIAALFFMDPGDVLLIEAETETGMPVESETLDFIAIRLAVACKIVVIEPAGNGNHDLDAFLHRGKPILNRQSPHFRESGAIVVGASDPIHGHIKAGASSYGSRVDCFAWGNYCATTSCSTVTDILDNGGGDDNKSYRSSFNGTSSAAPIVAGAALLVQGLWTAKLGTELTSSEMRDILSNPLTGTPQGITVPGQVPDHIGVMPDLAAIIAANGLGEHSGTASFLTSQSNQQTFQRRSSGTFQRKGFRRRRCPCR